MVTSDAAGKLHTGAARQFSEIRSNGPLRYHPISTMESMANMAPFSRHNGPASPPAAHKPTALCPRLPLRPLPSTRLARPSLLPFIPPLPAPGRPAESLAWRCVAGALLGFGNKNTPGKFVNLDLGHGDHLGPRRHGEDLYMSHAPTRHSHGITRSDTVLDVQKGMLAHPFSLSVDTIFNHLLIQSPFIGHLDFAAPSTPHHGY